MSEIIRLPSQGHELTPREVVRELDRYIIGQDEASSTAKSTSSPPRPSPPPPSSRKRAAS